MMMKAADSEKSHHSNLNLHPQSKDKSLLRKTRAGPEIRLRKRNRAPKKHKNLKKTKKKK